LYAILGEDESDVETLNVLVRRLALNTGLSVKRKGYDSCGELLRKGAAQLRSYLALGCTRFVVCYDSDGEDPQARYAEVLDKILKPAAIRPYVSGMPLQGIASCCCVLIPIQEIEAWILADIEAVTNVFTSWKPSPIKQNPETIPSPKEYLERLSRQTNKKPIYHHATHNQVVARHLNLELVRSRCPSFGPLVDFVLN
jgi:hypothetical protein